MKKIIAFALVVVMCLFALCSCGDKELKEFAASLSATIADEATATITVTSADGTEMVSTSTLVDEGANSLVLTHYNEINFDTKGTYTVPATETGETSGTTKLTDDPELISLGQLDFNKKYFANKAYTLDTNYFTATVTDPSAFFATPIAATSVDVEIEMRNGSPKKITVEYEAGSGSTVKIEVKYGY